MDILDTGYPLPLHRLFTRRAFNTGNINSDRGNSGWREACWSNCHEYGAGQAIGGYQRGASQARSGVDQNYQLELGANKQIYVSQVDAAGQIRSAGLEAAKLRQAAAVIAAVGREISREVGQGMRIRF